MLKKLAVLFCAASLATCSMPNSSKAENVEKAFYFWKSEAYELSGDEDSLLNRIGVRKLYVKFFEVEADSILGGVPTAKTKLYLKDSTISVVPTVYIRNEVFKNATEKELYQLADNVDFLIRKYGSIRFRRNPVDEYQMDCDWTKSTKDHYFYFLKSLKRISGKQISCTLRLYPYKYQKQMGLPPVDRVMLMCYNLTSPLKDKSTNSIFDADELESYLGRDRYPLPIDVALPVYSWMHVYQNNKFTRVLRATPAEFNGTLKSLRPMWYEATQDIVVDGFFVRRGDRIKYESVSTKEINRAVDIVKSKVSLPSTVTVSLFHLDAEQLKIYQDEEISRFYTRFTE